MSTNAQQKLDALGFRNKHGLNATRDAYGCRGDACVALS